MIVGLEGEVVHKEPMLVWIQCAGITYEVHISLQTSSQIQKGQVNLFITQIIRDDGNFLYGFLHKEEKYTFERLIRVNGIGPKVSLAILSSFSPSEFTNLLASKDTKSLQKVPGVGAKSAGRIMVELAGFILQTGSSEEKIQARMALEALGFRSEQVTKVLATLQESDVQTIIKEALKQLQGE
ncbi:Holliday junction branch migration protein RuvA [Helicobacter monodelphidis]|uniref:Holliday junction branch migration protein RuvA n=1 Tax=Helicobacter sp. 15-1451 TaxID=2004995 RepID=UPI000DCC4BE5|nr:Holliday junction branch migration protein RuvA [Helicobacter sp. 15-1451]RAX57678.1 Holliday junction branch migration protein RuvA [Helicobacter sp. 15-1451]